MPPSSVLLCLMNEKRKEKKIKEFQVTLNCRKKSHSWGGVLVESFTDGLLQLFTIHYQKGLGNKIVNLALI